MQTYLKDIKNNYGHQIIIIWDFSRCSKRVSQGRERHAVALQCLARKYVAILIF